MTFADLRLAEPILLAVKAEGYSTPTPIQNQAIPHVLAGRDMLGCAQTGTGKTAAFALPLLHRLAGQNTATAPRRPRALVLSPTRELAAQIGDSFWAYGKHTGLRHTVIFGGVSQMHQERALRNGVDIIVATPGRLVDLMQQGHVDLRTIEVFVLDEADRMLDMGFIHSIRKVVAKLPAKRQTLLFSATMPAEIRQLANSLLRQPVEVHAAPTKSPAAETVEQYLYHVAKAEKPALLRQLLGDSELSRTLVFTRTKHGADRVVKFLRAAGIGADAIHGNKKQSQRERALRAFKSSQTTVLVATDIASRGIDIDEISHVINYDMPVDAETYIHRIGRTGRAGASGVAFSFCSVEEHEMLRSVERLLRQRIPVRGESRASAPRVAVAPAASVAMREPRQALTAGKRSHWGKRPRVGAGKKHRRF